MILILIGLIITLYSLIDFKKALCFYVVYQVFWHPTATLVHFGGFPTISVSMFMNMFFFAVYFVKYKVQNRRSENVKFPFLRPFLVVYFSFFASCFTSIAGFSSEFSRSISLIIQDYLLIPVIWDMIDTSKDKEKLIRLFVITFLLAGMFSLYEYMIKDNPFVKYKSTLNENGIRLYSETAVAKTRGYRIVSFFEHPIGGGMTLALFVVFVVYMFSEKEKITPKIYQLLSYGAVVFCLIGIILTKMRASLFFLLIAMLAVVNFKDKRFYKLLAISCLGLVMVLPAFKDNINILASLFNKAAQKEVGGSSIEQRIGQFQAILHIFMQSPIAGLGEKFEEYITNDIYAQKALGYESVWFIQMTRHGLIGIIANVYLAFYMIIKVPYLYKSKKASFLGLAFWMTYTLTSIPSFRMTIFYLLYFYCLKNSSTFRNKRWEYNKRLNDAVSLLPSWVAF